MGYLRRKTLEWLPAIAVAVASAAWHVRAGGFLGDAAWVFEGLCRELVAGTTEGRQALVASGWHPPLPLLVGAPAAACAPAAALPWAAVFTAAAAAAVALYTLNRTLGRCFAGRNPGASLARAAAWIACAALFAHVTEPFAAATAAAGVVAVCKLAEWWDSGGLSDLVKLAFAIAALALCGFATAGIALALFILMPLPVLWKPSLKGRFSGVFVLGALPGVYAVATWCLMCWLILGDAFYPLRGVSGNIAWAPHAPPPQLLFLFCAMPAAILALRWRDPLHCAVAAALLMSFAWYAAAGFAGIGWSRFPTWCVIAVGWVILLARAAGQSPRDHGGAGPRTTRTGGAIQGLSEVVFILVAAVFARAGALSGAGAAAVAGNGAPRLIDEIRADVEARTPYGRVFVCGYAGQSLLRGARPEPFTPCLDPYIDGLRMDYERQHIFLLMPAPVNESGWESLYWRYPGIYGNGTQRLLFARDFGAAAVSPSEAARGAPGGTVWRLYELVSAPSEEQLREWRGN